MTTLLRLGTCNGTGCGEPPSIVPLPSSPYWFTPHFQTVPSERSAMELLSPAETDTMLLRPTTWTALERVAVVPSPSSPLELLPQDQTVPSERSASVWNQPAEIEVMFEAPRTWTPQTSPRFPRAGST